MRALTHVALPGWDPLVEPIVQIDAGHAHSLAVTSGGRLFSWGSNEFAQLGRGPVVSLDSRTANRAHEPAQVRISNAADGGGESLPVRLVAAGGYHSLLITWSGEVWSFGSNSHGQLARPVLLAEQAKTATTYGGGGGGGTTDMSTSHVQPRQARLPAAARGSSTIAIAAGLRHSVLLLKSGAVCTFGDHSHGQLGRLAPNRLNTCDVFPLDSSSSMATPSSMVMKPPSSEGMQEEPHQQADAKSAGANDPSSSAEGASAAEEPEEEERVVTGATVLLCRLLLASSRLRLVRYIHSRCRPKARCIVGAITSCTSAHGR